MTKEVSKAFILLSKKDLKTAQLIKREICSNYDEFYVNSLCYYASQIVEKILKSILSEYESNLKYSHKIVKLVSDVENLNVKVPDIITNNDKYIEEWSTSARYDVNYLGDYKLAINIIDVCDDWINNLEHVSGIENKSLEVKGF